MARDMLFGSIRIKDINGPSLKGRQYTSVGKLDMKCNGVLKAVRAPRRAGLIATLALVFLAGPVGAHEPTDFEQFMLELINRARDVPLDEVMRTMDSSEWAGGMSGLNEGLLDEPISDDHKQPLAFNGALFDAADDYSDLLLDNSAFEHQFGGMDPGERMVTAGYSFEAPWLWSENLTVTLSTDSLSITADEVDVLHTGMFADEDSPTRSRRLNMMNPDLREIGVGIGIRTDAGYMIGGQSYNAILTTQDYATSAGSNLGDPFLTGVVYNDDDDDVFYTPGEGLTLTVEVYDAGTNNLVASIATFASGGYTLGGLEAGFYNVRFFGGRVDQTFFGIDFTSDLNFKLDAINPILQSLIGDANGDRTVNVADYTLWANQFGQTGPGLSADFNNNNVVDPGDYTAWANHVGEFLPGSPFLIGDANGDRTVNAADYTLWANQFGQTGPAISADFNNNNVVDAGDYTAWANHFGESLPASPSSIITAAVPEPPAAALAGLGGLLAITFFLVRRHDALLGGAASGGYGV